MAENDDGRKDTEREGGVVQAGDKAAQFKKLLRVVKTRVNMMEGYVRQRPHMLKKLSSDVVTEISTLQIQLDEVEGLAEAEKLTFKAELNDLGENAMVYFDASNGLENESLTIQLPLNTDEKGDDLFKLKGCKPPVFSGDVREYQQWKQHFDAAVHNNTRITDDHRMVHLLSCTRSTARDFLRGYPATGASYNSAYEDLGKRFGDPTKLAQTFYADLAKLPELYEAEPDEINLKMERKNLDMIKTIILNLQTCGSFDTELVQGWVLKKMKKSRCEAAFDKLLEKFPQLNFPLNTLIENLEAGIYAHEVLELRVSSVKTSVVMETQSQEETQENFTTLVGKARAKRDAAGSKSTKSRKNDPPQKPSSSKPNTQLPCLFCEGKHVSAECRNLIPLAERKAKLEEIGRCTVCIGTTHTASRCNNRERTCFTCKKPGHSSTLCLKTIRKLEEAASSRKRQSDQGSEQQSGGSAKKSRHESKGRNKESGTFLETFICSVEIDGERDLVRGVIDGGSNVSYIHTNVLRRLKVNAVRNMVIGVQGIGSDDFTPVRSGNVKVTFIGQNEQHRSCNLFITDKIVGNSRLTPSPDEVSAILPYSMDYADPDIFNKKQRPIEVLVGNDARNLVVRLNRDRRLDSGLVLRSTIFGWIPSGKATNAAECNSLKMCVVSNAKKLTDKAQTETDQVSLLWDLEVLGIRSTEVDTTENAVIEQFRQTTRFENSRFIVSWPRRTEVLNLPTHYRMCVARLKSLLSSTENNVIEQCDAIIKDQLESGVIEKAPSHTRYETHYIPFKPVVVEGKSPRIVYDASAGCKSNQSLNDRLHSGPVLTGDLVGILLNFRLREIGIVSDIEKAFLQVGLDVADRDVVRFLWVEDCSQTFENTKIEVYRFARTPFGVVSSPFLLNMCLQELLADGENAWYEFSRSRFYVDNFVASVAQVEDAVDLYESLTEQLAKASFNLRDWTSNSSKFTNVVSEEKRMHADDPIKVLGLQWNRNTDTLSINFKTEDENCPISLRSALRILQAVFDPYGLVSPCLLELKLFIQECWKEKLKWDDNLPTSMEVRYRKLLAEREAIREIEFPRYGWSSKSDEGTYELHCFCDASKLAYGCALILVHRTRGKGEAQIIYTKQRIAPIQTRSIPQLELLALVVGKRAVFFVQSKIEVKVEKTVLWVDATTVIQWLHSSKIQVQFVQNRLNEVRKAPNLIVKYVPSEDNVADILTRGQKAPKLRDNNLWWKGPRWLVNEKLWPASPLDAPEFRTHLTSVICLSNVTITSNAVTLISDQFENRYSTWETSVKRILRLPFLRKKFEKSLLSDAEMFMRAELVLLRLIQQKYFPLELKTLQEGARLSSDNLDLFLHEDGLIRCQGPLRYIKINGEVCPVTENLLWDTVHPIFLPRRSKLVQNLIRYVHRKNFHVGAEQTLTDFRERFWITKGRSMINSIIHRCIICKRWKGGPYQLPPMPPLPHARISPVVPFVNTGVDHFGPFHVRHVNTEETSKVYGVIFVCLVTRAVHIELVSDLSADQFLQALIRFTSRRGVPQLLISDNAKNLKYVQPLLGQQMEILDSRLKAYTVSQGISWYFISAYSPWEGGVYERLIGLIKRTIVFVIGSKIVDYITLNTALCQVENIVNSRPLTHVSANEIMEVLTPNSFLKPARTGPETQLEVTTKNATEAASLLKGYKATRRIVEQFTSTFYSRYLRFLRERHNRLHKSPKGAVRFSPKVGHVVLVKVADSSRAKWPLGKIEELDQRKSHAWVRIIDWAASNRMKAKSDSQQLYRTKVVKKPVNALYPLEVEPAEENDPDAPPCKRSTPSTSS